MSNYAEDYRLFTREEKISLLQELYKTATKDEQRIIVEEVRAVLKLPCGVEHGL